MHDENAAPSPVDDESRIQPGNEPEFKIPQVILDAANAKREFYYLLSTGEVVEGPQGSWRNRIGPYPTREAAAQALALARHRDAAWEEQTKAFEIISFVRPHCQNGAVDREQEKALRVVEERDIRFVRLWFTDVTGILKSVAIAPVELEHAFEEGIGFDGSALEGLARVYESDMIARPDAATFSVLPWRGDSHGTARMFCDILMPDGEPALAEPRNILKRTLDKASALGFTCYTHPEVEFYLFETRQGENAPLVPADQGGYFDHLASGISTDFRRDIINILEEMGITVEYSHHEAGPGQNEIDLRYTDALTTADNIMTLRTVVKESALEHGALATFMPKPLWNKPGSGMHTHMSLFEGNRNAFFQPEPQYDLSKTARSFIAGLLKHAPEISAITNQHVNSYKRLWGGSEAPSYVCWGHNNRSALIRVPMAKPGKGKSTRIEYRALDSAANPYLAYAVMIAAGLKGITENYELPEPMEDDVWDLTDGERKALGIEPLPSSLEHAIELMENSELVAETLGEAAFRAFLDNKRAEWEGYRQQVTHYELERYLQFL